MNSEDQAAKDAAGLLPCGDNPFRKTCYGDHHNSFQCPASCRPTVAAALRKRDAAYTAIKEFAKDEAERHADEIAALQHDIERHVKIAAEQATEIERLRDCQNPLDPCRECIHCLKTDWVWKQRDNLRAELARVKAELREARKLLQHASEQWHQVMSLTWMNKVKQWLAAQSEEGT